MNNPTQSFKVRYDLPSRVLLTGLGLGQGWSGVDVSSTTVSVRMGWGFHAEVPRSAITSVSTAGVRSYGSRGVHGWGGQWLVNGAGDGLVAISIDPAARATVCGIPVKLRRLIVSVENPNGLIAALAPALGPGSAGGTTGIS